MTPRDQVLDLKDRMGRSIIGQEDVVERLLLTLLCNGNVLVEGLPGLAKTRAVKSLAANLEADFSRIQFTPDLLPADLIGTLVYNPQSGDFTPKKGPIFANLILADEINRAPAKVQSALLEAMQERQVTIGEYTYPLDEPFLVLATQTPSNKRVPIPCPRPRWTALCSRWSSPTPTDGRKGRSWSA